MDNQRIIGTKIKLPNLVEDLKFKDREGLVKEIDILRWEKIHPTRKEAVCFLLGSLFASAFFNGVCGVVLVLIWKVFMPFKLYLFWTCPIGGLR